MSWLFLRLSVNVNLEHSNYLRRHACVKRLDRQTPANDHSHQRLRRASSRKVHQDGAEAFARHPEAQSSREPAHGQQFHVRGHH